MKCGYTTADIQIPDGLEPIRRRPGMYTGGTDARGLHHMLFELVDDALAAGDRVSTTLGANNVVEICDDRTPPENVEAMFSAFPWGHSGIGHAVANALSEELTFRVRTPGCVYQHTFRRGQTHAAMQFGGPPDDRGLTIRFRPDPDIFGSAQFDPDTIRERLRQCAFLNSGVRITFTDETNGTEDVFEHANGIADYVKWVNTGRTTLHHEVIALEGEADGVRYEIGLQWCADDALSVSFANGHRTHNGGTHENGLRKAVRDTVRNFLRTKFPDEQFKRDDTDGGMTAVVAVHLNQPQFEGATHNRLRSPEVERVIATEVERFFSEYLDENSAIVEVIARRILTERDVREAYQAASRKQK